MHLNGLTVQNIQIDGQRPQLGLVPDEAEALMEMGGASTGQVIQNVYAHDPRGWSALHLIGATTGPDGTGDQLCQNALVQNNSFGPNGTPDGHWADGISFQCANSLVQDNTITDATDGGIVVFGATGSTIRNNTIIAKTQTLLGGINMVDAGDYTGTTVTGNVIDAQGALIKVGVGMGQKIWGCGNHPAISGALVTNNTLQGQHMGYGFAVSDVTNWTVTGNVDNSTHVGYLSATTCDGVLKSAPSGFQNASATNSNLQPEFVSGQQLTGLLGLSERPTTISLRARANGKFVTAESGGAQPLIANRVAVGPWEKFDVTYLSGGYVRLRAEANNKFVCAENYGNSPLIANRDSAGTWETFRLVKNTDQSVSLIAQVNNKFVTAESGGTQPLIANRTTSLGWERFDLFGAE
ncbi:hypothetical protein A6A27_39640 [Micromonospora sp. CB01531]|nr:hypothetical protein A6A27_39640 [Micromonospora sp. CB01531]